MLAVSAAFAIYRAASKYKSCRADGYGQVLCFIPALLFDGFFGILEFAVGTVAKSLRRSCRKRP
jgi:hypothetical protein